MQVPEDNSIARFGCKFLPVDKETKNFSDALKGPFLNLIDLWNLYGLLFAWLVFFVLYLIVYNVVPLCFMNSSDNQYINTTRVLVSTLVLYQFVSMIIIYSFNSKFCEPLVQSARDYLYTPKPPLPSGLREAYSILKNGS